MKMPSQAEIVKARGAVKEPTDRELLKVMECWDGAGWHPSELLYGILVGLVIAENRQKRKPQAREVVFEFDSPK